MVATEKTYEQLIQQGTDYLNANLNEEALDLLEQAIVMQPNMPDLHYGKAIALARLGYTGEAIETLHELLILQPLHSAAKQLLNELPKTDWSIQAVTPQPATHLPQTIPSNVWSMVTLRQAESLLNNGNKDVAQILQQQALSPSGQANPFMARMGKPIDNPEHISLLLPTRGRPGPLKKVFDSLEANTLDKRLIDVWVYVDEDDELTRAFIHAQGGTKYGFDINWIVGERLHGGSARLANELWQKCTTNAGIYMGIADDYIFVKKFWDVLVRQAFTRCPDRILVAYPEDPTAAPGQITHVILSAEWLNLLGRFMPDYFPFWYSDTWIDQVAQLIQRKVKLDMRMEPQGGKGKTWGMKNLVFWNRFFNNMLDERISEADTLRRAIYLPDSPEYQKSVQEAQILIQQAQLKSIQTADATLIAMEENYALKSAADPIKEALYFISETNALGLLFRKFYLLYAQNRIDESLGVLDDICRASLLKSNETAYMRSIGFETIRR
jgi:tetratricopeptide (TPR) repeat protein